MDQLIAVALIILEVNMQRVNFFHLFHQIFAAQYRQIFLILRYFKLDNLNRVLSRAHFERHKNLVDLFERLFVVDVDHVSFCHQENGLRLHVDAARALSAPVVDDLAEAVVELAFVDVEVRLALFVSDAQIGLDVDHQLVALHEVEHGVLQARNQLGVFVEDVEIDQLVGYDLELVDALDVVDEALDVEREVLAPLQEELGLRTLVQDHFLLKLELEEHDLVRLLHNQDLIIVEVHLSKVKNGYLLLLHLLWFVRIHRKSLPLSIKDVTTLFFVIIKCVAGIILRLLNELCLNRTRLDLFLDK